MSESPILPPISKEERKKFIEAWLNNGMNQTAAYLSIRPNVKPNTAQNMGSYLMNKPGSLTMVKQALARHNLGIDDIADKIDKAVTAGLGKKATNRDAIAGLKLAADITLGHESTDLDGIQHQDLEEQSVDDLVAKLDEMKHNLLNTKRSKSVEGEIIDSK
jgi:hypothetical protein